MQIYYCDKCGMRIPQAQIDNGQAARLNDEKLACPACARHAAPRPAARPQAKSSGIHLDAVQPIKNPASSGTLVPYQRPARESGAAHDRHDRLGGHGGHGHGAKGADTSSSAKLYAGAGIGFFVVLLGVIFASGGNKKVETDRRDAADIPKAKAADAPAPTQTKGPQLLTPPPRTSPDPRTDPEPTPLPAPELPAVHAGEDREDLAADAFDVLKKFEGLAVDDKDGRKRKIESFIETYADTMAGARARVLLQNLESGLTAVNPEDEPEPAETPAERAATIQPIRESVADDGSRIVTVALSNSEAAGTESETGVIRSSGVYLNIGSSDMKTVTFVHFPDLPVPPQARILEAHIQFTSKYPERASASPVPSMTVEAEAADDSLPADKLAIGKRARTQAHVEWTVPPWSATGEQGPDQRTPDLSSVVQEVVNRPGWQANNSILFLFSKGKRRSAYPPSRKNPARAPVLTVRYRAGGGGGPAPAVPETASGPALPAVTGDAGLLQVLAVLAPVLRKGEFDDAAERVEVLLKDPNFAGAAEALVREKRDLAGVLALREATLASLNEGGKAVKLNKGKLDLDGKTVRGTDHSKVTVRITGGPEMVVYAREFSVEEIARYAPQPKTADERRAHAYLHLATGDIAQAKAVLVEAGKNGDPGLEPYLDRLALAALDANSLKAKAAWLGVEKRVADGQFAEADAELKAFKNAFGDTAFAKDIAASVLARTREIDKVLNPYLPGLKGEYFRSGLFKADEKQKERIDANIKFQWGSEAPMAGVPNNFHVRWTGFLKVPQKGTYTLSVTVDDGARVWIDGKQIIDHWPGGAEKKVPATIDLEEGYRNLRIDFNDTNATATLILQWALKGGFAEQVVPPEALWHRDETKPASADASTDKPRAITLAPGDGIYLGEIKPQSASIGGGKYAADGTLGFSTAKISVDGEESPHGICTHPFENGECVVRYELDRPYRQFVGHAAINDNAKPKVPLTFRVDLDGKTAWTSRPFQAKGEFEAFAIDVTGAKVLEIKVDCPGSNDRAVAVWFEPRLLLQPPAGAASGSPAGQVFLSDLEETSATVVAGWFFGKKGKMGNSSYKNDSISANGIPSPNGINMTPPEKDKAIATYAIDKKYAVFESRVAICDTSKDRAKAPAIFKVYGDDRLLWQSQPIQMTKVIEDCKVDVRDVSKLTLEVECPKVNLYLHTVWLEPRLLSSSQPSIELKAVELKAGEGAYLSDLQESDLTVYSNFGKNGELGFMQGKIKVKGVDSPHGLGLHPNGNGNSRVTYRLDGKYRQFLAFAAISDSETPMTPLVFSVEVDGKNAWTSQPLKARGQYEACAVDVANAKSITLLVACNGPNAGAHAVWFEPHLLVNSAAQVPAKSPAQVYLSDLPEQDVSVVANWTFGKRGQTGAPAGDKNVKILVAGFESPNGLGLHPPTSGKSHVAYQLDKKFRTFTARVGLNDSSANKAASPVIFKVLGDGKVLWQSKSIQKINSYDGCNLVVIGVDKLELEVECRGDASRCHAVWIEPLLSR